MYGDRAGKEINYVPLMEVTYWGFRLMITFGGLAAFAALVALWMTRKGTVPDRKWISRLAVFGILAPFAANSAGWIFTEMGRQPFVVAPNPTRRHRPGLYVHGRGGVPGGERGRAALLLDRADHRVRGPAGGRGDAAGAVHPRRRPGGHARTAAHDDGAPGGKDDGDVLAFAY